MFTTSTLISLSAAMAVGFAACGQSAAAQDSEVFSTTVFYGDLNLANEAGARVMLQRIRNAAEKVCGTEYDGDPLSRLMEWAPCVKSTTARAVAAFGNPIVTVLNSDKHGAAPKTLASNR